MRAHKQGGEQKYRLITPGISSHGSPEAPRHLRHARLRHPFTGRAPDSLPWSPFRFLADPRDERSDIPGMEPSQVIGVAGVASYPVPKFTGSMFSLVRAMA